MTVFGYLETKEGDRIAILDQDLYSLIRDVLLLARVRSQAPKELPAPSTGQAAPAAPRKRSYERLKAIEADIEAILRQRVFNMDKDIPELMAKHHATYHQIYYRSRKLYNYLESRGQLAQPGGLT